jgi:hypothetical protein
MLHFIGADLLKSFWFPNALWDSCVTAGYCDHVHVHVFVNLVSDSCLFSRPSLTNCTTLPCQLHLLTFILVPYCLFQHAAPNTKTSQSLIPIDQNGQGRHYQATSLVNHVTNQTPGLIMSSVGGQSLVCMTLTLIGNVDRFHTCS